MAPKPDILQHVRERVGLPSRPFPGKGSDPWVWCKEKAAHESAAAGSPQGTNLWLVHGKWYDLNEFADKHPGGKDWIYLTKGQDITEAYEVHHLNSKKADAVLKKFYVADASESYAGRYNWDENSFYKVLKSRVCEHFLKKPKRENGLPDSGSTVGFKLLCTFAIAVHFLCFYYMLKVLESPGTFLGFDLTSSLSGAAPGAGTGSLAALWIQASLPLLSVLCAGILAGFTLQPFHGIGHNALHMKDNIWMYAYDFCGWKHHRHRVSHDLSHHLFPNTLIDIEHPEPTSYVFQMNAHRNSPWVIFMGPLWMWSGPLRDILSLWRELITSAEPFRFEYLFNMIQCLLCMVFGSHGGGGPGAVLGFLTFGVMHFTCGLCIESAGFGLHRSIFCWTEGDDNAKIDFGEHCLASTADHDCDWDLLSSLYCFQILNNHGIHHLFPTVCKSRIAEVMPIFKEACKEFNVPWQEYVWSEIFVGLWKNWLKGLFTDTPMISTAGKGHAPVPGSKMRIHDVQEGPKYTRHEKNAKDAFGAIITGVDLANVSDAEFDVIKETWEARGVMCFREQKLTPHEELAWARRFPHCRTCEMEKFCGPRAEEGFDADEWRQFKLKERPEIQLRGHAELKDYFGVTGMLDTGKGVLEYHSDSLHEYDTPPIYTELYCKETPGKDETLFIDTRLAYDLLSREEKKKADSLFVQYRRQPQPLHESGLCADFKQDPSVLGKLYASTLERRDSDASLSPKSRSSPTRRSGGNGDAVLAEEGDNAEEDQGSCAPIDVRTGQEVTVSEVHPLVWTHPSTGRKAIISASMWMFRIVEKDGTPWTQQDSHDYLHGILKRVEPYRYEHVWQPGDLVCFDNRSVMHSANTSSIAKGNGRRLLHQIILCGDQIPQGPAGVGVGNPIVNPQVEKKR